MTFEQLQDRTQRKQAELDLSVTRERQATFASQLEEEPQKIAALYEVQMSRVSPVGLVLAWPEAG